MLKRVRVQGTHVWGRMKNRVRVQGTHVRGRGCAYKEQGAGTGYGTGDACLGTGVRTMRTGHGYRGRMFGDGGAHYENRCRPGYVR